MSKPKNRYIDEEGIVHHARRGHFSKKSFFQQCTSRSAVDAVAADMPLTCLRCIAEVAALS